jgi:hypothetical protein
MKKYCLIILSFLIVSCGSTKEQGESGFDKSYRMDNLEEFSVPPILLKELKLVATENFLVTYSATKDSIFKVFDNKSLEYLGSFGQRGNGPDDYSPVTSSIIALENDRLFIGNLRFNREIQLSKSVKGSSEKFSAQVIAQAYIPGQIIPLNDGFKLDDHVFGGANRKPNNQIVLFDAEKNQIRTIFPYPNFVEGMPEETYDILYQRRVSLSKDGKRVVVAYLFFPRILVFDIDQNKVISDVNIDMSPYLNENFRVMADGRNINAREFYIYYTDLLLTENRMYAKLQLRGPQNGVDQQVGEKELHVFDKEGKPIVRLLLEDWMNNFAITPDDEYIYFWHPEVLDKIFRYKLSNIVSEVV